MWRKEQGSRIRAQICNKVCSYVCQPFSSSVCCSCKDGRLINAYLLYIDLRVQLRASGWDWRQTWGWAWGWNWGWGWGCSASWISAHTVSLIGSFRFRCFYLVRVASGSLFCFICFYYPVWKYPSKFFVYSFPVWVLSMKVFSSFVFRNRFPMVGCPIEVQCSSVKPKEPFLPPSPYWW